MTSPKSPRPSNDSRLPVAKTYKLFIKGTFPRSESGYTFKVFTAAGDHIANAAKASRKDTRDAVTAARGAMAKWSTSTAYLRGQILYRIAEMLEGRREQFVSELTLLGIPQKQANLDVDQAIETWVYYAGFADKFAQIVGAANPVAAPYFNFSIPEPTGVVAVVTPEQPSLAGLAASIAPIIVSGNTCVIIAPEAAALTAITFAEVIATSDVPAGVVNILTGIVTDLAPIAAGHMDINAIDLSAVTSDVEVWKDWEALAAENLKRVIRPNAPHGDRSLDAITRFIELKTVWHPIGV